MNHRAVVKQEYQVILRTADGKEHTWPISDCYFERKLETIGRKMLDVIRHEDLTHQFSLSDETIEAQIKFKVTLVDIESMQQKTWVGTAPDRYDAVRQAYKDLLDHVQEYSPPEWKVLEAGEMKS